MLHLIIAIIIAYLLGSIATSIILAKIQKRPDPRSQGSGNAGATNVLRNSGKTSAAIVLVGDALKGWLAVVIARLLHLDGAALGIVAIAVIVGHMFPVFFKFKGGKGVATYFGTLLAISILGFIIAVVIWAATALLTRYASLASIISAVASSIILIFLHHATAFIPMLIAALLITWMHRTNINKLKNGTENKIRL
jgi:acyl phosphate:glycerol-3-phosphate acyltransferase